MQMKTPAMDSSAESTPSTNVVVEESMSPFRSAETTSCRCYSSLLW